MATEPLIGTAIKRARERKRWTQRQLADALRVNIKTVDNWENGRTSPRSSIGAIEEVLGISLDGGQAEPEPDDDWERWERSVLTNADLPPDLARSIVLDARAAREAEAGASPAAPSPVLPAARTAGRHRSAG